MNMNSHLTAGVIRIKNNSISIKYVSINTILHNAKFSATIYMVLQFIPVFEQPQLEHNMS